MNSHPRVAFLGTPDVAVPALVACHGVADVRVVITQPDRPRGRSGAPQAPPIKVTAAELSLPVAQPATSATIAAILRDAGPLDAAVLVAFGQLIRADAIAVPRHGIVNAHFSLLPRWRGAAPVQHALLAGDPRTGITMMLLDPGLDTGPVLSAWSTAIGPTEDAGTLSARLAAAAAQLVPATLVHLVEGRALAVPQPPTGASHAGKLGSGDRTIDWSAPAATVLDKVRALSPRPGAATTVDGGSVKILAVRLAGDGSGDPGLLEARERWPVVTCGSGALLLERVQPAGGTVMDGDAWLRGLRTVPERVG